MRDNETMKKAALDFANRLRKQLGFKPVKRLAKGYRRKSKTCTISATVIGRRKNVEVHTNLSASEPT